MPFVTVGDHRVSDRAIVVAGVTASVIASIALFVAVRLVTAP